MYLFFGIFFLVLFFFFCINHWRRKKIIKKVCNMCMAEKVRILDEIISPFGYCYVPSQDIFTSRLDALQRDFGYCALYDKAAPFLKMVFDSLPVYFNYNGRTWLIEFWKGQYGINTGCEIGVYYADHIIAGDKLESTLFHCVDNEDMPFLSLVLFRSGKQLAKLHEKHWWLTAFCMGCFTRPSNLSLLASITFPTPEMANAFAGGLLNAGCQRNDINVCCCMVTFPFARAAFMPGNWLRRLAIWFAQCSNRIWCKIYLLVTRPFCLSVDRLLYLYYYLPFAFRRMFRLRRWKTRQKKKAEAAVKRHNKCSCRN